MPENESNYLTIGFSNTINADSTRVEIDSDANSVVVTWWKTNQTSDVPVMRVSDDNGKTFGPLLNLATNGTFIQNADDLTHQVKNSQSNFDGEYLLNIVRVTSWLQCNKKVVICSNATRSRSPAIAIGVLVKYLKLDFYNAWEQVRKKVADANIDYHIMSIKNIRCWLTGMIDVCTLCSTRTNVSPYLPIHLLDALLPFLLLIHTQYQIFFES